MYFSASSYAGSTPGSIGGFHDDGEEDDADEDGPDVESGANEATDERRREAPARRQSRLVAQLAIVDGAGAEGERGCVRERKLRRMTFAARHVMAPHQLKQPGSQASNEVKLSARGTVPEQLSLTIPSQALGLQPTGLA